jgi:hypothetical protein
MRTAEAELEVDLGDPVDQRAPAAQERQRAIRCLDPESASCWWWLGERDLHDERGHLISQVTVSWCFMWFLSWDKQCRQEFKVCDHAVHKGYLQAVIGGPDVILALLWIEQQLVLLETCDENDRAHNPRTNYNIEIWDNLHRALLPSFLLRSDVIRRPEQFSSMPYKLPGIWGPYSYQPSA